MPKHSKISVQEMGKIDAASFGVKRRIEIDYQEFDEFMKLQVNNTRDEKSEIDKSKPFIGTKGEYTWPIECKLPQFLQDLTDEFRAMFQLKSEVESFGFKIWPKATKIDPKQEIKIEPVPTELAMQIGSRIYLTVGSSEHLEIFASARGRSGKGSVQLFENYGFLIPIGVSAGLHVIINNATSAKTEPKDGFRSMTFKKNPLKRYFIIIDCKTNSDILIKSIKKETQKANQGDSEKANMLADQITSSLGLSDVDKVVLVASQPTSEDLFLLPKSCQLDDVDKIVFEASKVD